MATENRPVDKMMRNLLQANNVFLTKALTPTGDIESEQANDLFLAQSMAAHYAAACAWLLDRLAVLNPGALDAAASELTDLMEDGEALADWAGDIMPVYGLGEA